MLALLGEWGVCMGEAVGGLRPVLFVLVWFGFAFFSQRESCRAERELSCIQERVGGLGVAVGGDPEEFESCAVTVPVLGKVAKPWLVLPTSSIQTPSRYQVGQSNGPSGITRGTENQRGCLECSLLTTLGPLPFEQPKELG